MATIPVYERQKQLAPLPGARVHASGGANAYGAGVGGAVQDLAEVTKAKILEFEQAEVMGVFNEFQKEIAAYHHDPESGVYNTKRGKNSFDMAETSVTDMDNIGVKFEDKLQNDRMVGAFREMAGPLMNQQYKANMAWESKEIDAYRDAESNAIIANGYNEIGNAYDNDGMVDAIVYRMEMALAAQLMNEPEEVYFQKWRDMKSNVALFRTAQKMQSDPIAAQEWFEAHKNEILPEARLKAEVTLKGRVLSVQASTVAKEAFSQFNGEYDQSEGLQWIAENVADEELREAAKGKYTRLLNEKNMGVALAEAKVRDTQNQLFENVQLEYAKGGTRSDDEWLLMEAKGEVSSSQARWGLQQNEGIANKGKSLRALSKRYPDWSAKSEPEQDVLFMQENKITNEMHEESVALLGNLLIDGKLNKTLVDDYQNNARITRNEQRKFHAALDGMEKVQNVQLSNVKNFFSKTINPSTKDSPFYGRYTSAEYSAKMAEYNVFVMDMMVNQDPDIVQKATDKADEVINDLLSGISLQYGLTENDYTKTIFGIQTPFSEPTRFNESVKATRENLASIRSINSMEKPSRIAPDPISLSSPGAVHLPENVEALSADILGGEYQITSGYTESRNGGKRQHNGYDFAAPKGTPIKVPGLGLRDMKVTATVTDQSDSKKGAGNYVRLEGVDAAGNVIEIQMNHMDSVQSMNVGDTLSPGSLLGTVGNSGSTYSKTGGDGSHLDLKMKVNGKPVDPSSYLKGAQAAAGETPQPQDKTPRAKSNTEIMAMSEEERARYIFNGGVIE